jgi:crotonobetainyl-CoA:carnitine CoA-transferase CaiB-like acyl-CoA transferase
LDRLVEEWTSQRPPEEVVTLMQAAGVGAGLVANVGDLYEDPQFKHYHCFQEFDHSVLGKLSFYIPPGFTLFKASYWEIQAPGVAYTEILGIPDEEFVELIQDGVFD